MRTKILFLESELNKVETDHKSQLQIGEKLRESLLEKLQDLQDEVQNQKNLVITISVERDDLVKSLNVLKVDSATNSLNKMLDSGKRAADTRGLGFLGSKTSLATSTTKFVKTSHSGMSSAPSVPKKFIPVYHFCGVLGHIRPRCNKLRSWQKISHRNLQRDSQVSLRQKLEAHLQEANRLFKLIPVSRDNMSKPRPMWVKKENHTCLFVNTAFLAPPSIDNDVTCLVALSALSAKKSDTWYFDSGCSRHMTGEKSWFSSFTDEVISSTVTFGDGRKAKILGRGTVTISGFPELNNVMLVEDLQANLISISQICDDIGDVLLTKEKCLVQNFNGKSVMCAPRSRDNCYCVDANAPSSLVCNKVSDNSLELWHKRLGHINYHDLLKLSNKDCVRGLPKLKGKK